MTDNAGRRGRQVVHRRDGQASVLEFNTHHDFEHYGNMVTYMRLKGPRAAFVGAGALKRQVRSPKSRNDSWSFPPRTLTSTLPPDPLEGSA